MDTPEYLNKVRKDGLLTDGRSEAELLTDPTFAENWKEILQIKKEMAEAKLKAINEINEQFKERLLDAEANYSIILTMSR